MVTRTNTGARARAGKPETKPEDTENNKGAEIIIDEETAQKTGNSDANVGAEIEKEDEKPTKVATKSINPIKDKLEKAKTTSEIDVDSLSDEQLARLAQRMGVVYNAPKSKIGNRKCFLKIYKDLPVIYIGKAREGQIHDPILNIMVTKLLYPITTMDGTETKITHDEYNSLERREYEFAERKDLSKDIELGDPIYNKESGEYVDNVRKEQREIFFIKINDQLVEVYSDGGAINA